MLEFATPGESEVEPSKISCILAAVGRSLQSFFNQSEFYKADIQKNGVSGDLYISGNEPIKVRYGQRKD